MGPGASQRACGRIADGVGVLKVHQLFHMEFSFYVVIDVYLYILRLSGNKHLAEEITSDPFFKAMKSIDKFREIAVTFES